MKDKQDLTTGSVPGKLAAFALPLLLANLLQWEKTGLPL